MDRVTLNMRLSAAFAVGVCGLGTVAGLAWGDKASWVAVGSLPIFLTMGWLGLNLIRLMNQALSKLVIRLAMNSNQIANASRDISLISEDLISGTQSQLAALKATSESLEKISFQAQKNAKNALETSQLSRVSLETASRGLTVTQEMVQVMGDIRRSQKDLQREIERNLHKLRAVTEVIHEIQLKAKVIDEIVLQSKILSFNAAVEAAKAGEQGKGFLVVAEEVNHLAQISGSAAKEMATLLSQSSQRVTSIVEETTGVAKRLIEQEYQKTQTGLAVAEDCAEVLKEIVDAVGTVDVHAKAIVESSADQSRGVEKVSGAAIQLESVTRANAESAAQGKQAAIGLNHQIQSLKAVMKILSQTIKGKMVPIPLQDDVTNNVIFIDEIRSQNATDKPTADRRGR